MTRYLKSAKLIGFNSFGLEAEILWLVPIIRKEKLWAVGRVDPVGEVEVADTEEVRQRQTFRSEEAFETFLKKHDLD